MTEEHEHHEKKSLLSRVKDVYEKDYKKLMIIPFLLLLLAFIQLGVQYSTTGDFVNKGISLKGGVSIVVPHDQEVIIEDLKSFFNEELPETDISVRLLKSAGTSVGFSVEADIDVNDQDGIDNLVSLISSFIGRELSSNDYTTEGMGSTLGESFFKETFKAVMIAFLLMGLVVFFFFCDNWKAKGVASVLVIINAFVIFYSQSIIMYFIGLVLFAVIIYIYLKHNIPSIAVIVAALSDIIVTIAIFNLTGFKLSTSGIAAFLMLIGYSVDTDILLSNRVLKRKAGTLHERIYSAMKTGFTMSGTTLVAMVAALVFTKSEVISQIMIILLIGLVVDLINTWIQNVGILKWYLEKKHKHHSENEG